MPSRFVDNAKWQREYTILQLEGAPLSIPSVFFLLFSSDLKCRLSLQEFFCLLFTGSVLWTRRLTRLPHVARWSHDHGQETRGRRNGAHRGRCDVAKVSCTCCTCGIMLKINRSWSCGLLLDTSYWKQGSLLGDAPPAPPHLPSRDGKMVAWRWWPRPPAPLMPLPPAESSHLPAGGGGNWSSCQLCP